MVNMNNSIIKHILLGGIITTLLTSCTGNYLDYNTNPYEVTKDEMGRDGYNLSAALIGMESYVVPVEEHFESIYRMSSRWSLGWLFCRFPSMG